MFDGGGSMCEFTYKMDKKINDFIYENIYNTYRKKILGNNIIIDFFDIKHDVVQYISVDIWNIFYRNICCEIYSEIRGAIDRESSWFNNT